MSHHAHGITLANTPADHPPRTTRRMDVRVPLDVPSDSVDFVVVPSFWFHCFFSTGGPHWRFLAPDDYAAWYEGSPFGPEDLSLYWSRIREVYGGYGGGKALIVVHHSFVMDTWTGSPKSDHSVACSGPLLTCSATGRTIAQLNACFRLCAGMACGRSWPR